MVYGKPIKFIRDATGYHCPPGGAKAGKWGNKTSHEDKNKDISVHNQWRDTFLAGEFSFNPLLLREGFLSSP